MSHGKNKRNFKVYDPLSFIADITQHIADKSFQLIRYYGWYSIRMRGDRLETSALMQSRAEDESPVLIRISDYHPKPIPSPLWRECIRKAFEVDPLICPSCSTEMRIISFIVERQVVTEILEHLNMYQDFPASERAPPAEPEITDPTISVEPVDDGWPACEEGWANVRE
jgi:hypothetical protein